MQVEIQNFRCWKKHIVNFNDKGIILINGTSGSGKSSILNAIFFAITGNGNKIVTYGEKKCCVKIKFQNEKIKEITRTKSPCRLTVKLNNDDIFEDEEAQKIIDSYYGNNFQQTSYMTQKLIHSFLNLSSNEKMTFLQKFLENNDNSNNIKNIKIKCKEKISELKKQHIEYKSKLSLYQDELNLIENNIKNNVVLSDYSYETISNFFKNIKEINYEPHKIKYLRDKQTTLLKEYNKYNNCKIQTIEYEKQKDELLNIIKDIELTKINLQNKLLNSEYNEDYYNIIIKNKNIYNTQKEINNIIKELESEYKNLNIYINEQLLFLENEKDKLLKKNNETLTELNCIHSDTNYIRENIDKWKKSSQTIVEYYNLLKDNYEYINLNLNDINNEILQFTSDYDNFKKILSEKQETLNKLKQNFNLRNKIHKCPKCSVFLRFDNKKENELIIDTTEQIDIISYKKNICEIENDIKMLNDKISIIQKNIFDKESKKSNFINYSCKLDNLKKRLSRADIILLKYLDFEYKLEKNMINGMISNIQIKINNLVKNLENHSKYNTDIDNFKLKLNNLSFSVQNINKSEINLKYIKNKINEIKIILDECLKNNSNQIVIKILNTIYNKLIILSNKNLDDIDIPNISEEETNEIYLKQSILKKEFINNKENLEKIINKYDLYTEKINKLNNEIEIINNYIIDNNEIINEYNLIEKQLNESYKIEEEYNKTTILSNIYKQWKRIYNEKKIQNYLFDTVSNDIVAHEIFLNKINETESISLTKCIDSINYYINDYLEKFFQNDSMIVDIVPFKEKIKNGKDKSEIKPGINIRVSYKGEEVELSSLSGGEYDRVSLAILLSFNHICKSNIILLDESVASLDSELTNDILEKLKENLSNKRIIVVAHQLSTGIFDQIINTK